MIDKNSISSLKIISRMKNNKTCSKKKKKKLIHSIAKFSFCHIFLLNYIYNLTDVLVMEKYMYREE